MRCSMILIYLLMLAGVVSAKEPPAPVNPDANCDATEAIYESPDDVVSGSFGGWWYRSEDSELWASAFRFVAGDNKTGWHKPQGSLITATGRRLDGEAAPMTAYFPYGYQGYFQASGLDFPTAGCWEVTAEAEGSTLTFVTYVYPRGYAQAPLTCDVNAPIVRPSSAILVVEVESDVPAIEPFIWQTLRVEEVVKGDIAHDQRVDILVDTMYEEPFTIGERYLVFLWQDLTHHLRAVCQNALILDDETLELNYEYGPLVDGQPLEEALTMLRKENGQ